MTTDPRERFTGIAATYARWRPSYPDALADWILALFAPGRPRRAADVGCGTGISSRFLAARGLDVVGVEPNEDMLAAARAERGGPRYVRGDAERTGLPDASFDLVASAQAFHWFDVPAAVAEFRRIARPDGWCAAWWNARTHTPFHEGYRALMRRFAEEYTRDLRDAAPGKAVDALRRIAACREAQFPHLQRFDFEGLRGRASTSSYVHRSVADRAGFDAALRRLFDEHAVDGVVDFPYECRAIAWRPRDVRTASS